MDIAVAAPIAETEVIQIWGVLLILSHGHSERSSPSAVHHLIMSHLDHSAVDHLAELAIASNAVVFSGRKKNKWHTRYHRPDGKGHRLIAGDFHHGCYYIEIHHHPLVNKQFAIEPFIVICSIM